jgi:hypothetical protein
MTDKNALPPKPQRTRLDVWAEAVAQRVVRLPRLMRVGLSALFALMVTLAVRPLIDLVYIDNFFNPDTIMLPALIATAIGVIIYGLGWRWLVGLVGETPTASRAVFWYMLVGFASLLWVIGLSVHGLVTALIE